jgi:hypothetical protein
VQPTRNIRPINSLTRFSVQPWNSSSKPCASGPRSNSRSSRSHSDQVTGRTWGEKGRTPVVRRSGNRFSVNVMSAISTKGRMHFMVFTESFTAEVMCRFLDRLAGHIDHKIHLVVDGHSAPRSRKVRDWLAAHPDDVELHFLPPYPPS